MKYILFVGWIMLLFVSNKVIADTEQCPIGYGNAASYNVLQYIQSSGSQWFDTGIVGNDAIKTEAKVKILSNGTSTLLASRSGSNRCYLGFRTYGGRILAAAPSEKDFKSVPDVGTVITAVYDIPNHKIYLDNTEYTYDGNGCNTNLTLYMFASHYDSSRPLSVPIICYYLKIWDKDGALIRDFIPVRRGYDGLVGMYDKVESKFYYSLSLENFIAGPYVGEQIQDVVEPGTCLPCPINTYKDFVGNGECTPCPDALISPSGSKSVSECGRVLHIGDKIYHLKSVKKTSPSLNVMDEYGHVFYGNLYSPE